MDSVIKIIYFLIKDCMKIIAYVDETSVTVDITPEKSTVYTEMKSTWYI